MIENKRLLKDLRRGIPPHKIVHIGGDNTNEGMDIAVVILSADKCLEIEELTQQYCSSAPTKVNDAVKSQFYNALLVAECMRYPTNLQERVAESFSDVMSSLDLEDIKRIVDAYGELMINKSPKLELITQEQIDELKKFLEVTPLNDLSTVLLVHLANCHQTIVSSY